MASSKTIYDIYFDRDRTEWYWRALGTLSASLILLGFLLFPTSFPAPAPAQTQAGSATLSIISVILLAVGYSLSVALWFICRSWLFQFDVIFLPSFLSCVLGALNVGINLGVRPPAPLVWSAPAIAAISLAITSALIYGALSGFVYYKIRQVRLNLSIQAVKIGDGAGSESATLIPEEELRRKHFERLLSQRDRDRASPVHAATNTYRIDIPDHAKLGITNGVQLHDRSQNTSPYGDRPMNSFSPSSQMSGLSPEQEFDYLQNLPGPELNPKQLALQQARERSLHNKRSRARVEGGEGTLPVIVNTRNTGNTNELGEISLSERHPLERQPHSRGNSDSSNKAGQFQGEVYRPRSDDHGGFDAVGGPSYEIVEGPQVELDLRRMRSAASPHRPGPGSGGRTIVAGELEARMPRERTSVTEQGAAGQEGWGRSQVSPF